MGNFEQLNAIEFFLILLCATQALSIFVSLSSDDEKFAKVKGIKINCINIGYL